MSDINRENYRNYDAVHYSLLSQVDRDPSRVLAEDKDFTDAMKKGDAVDIRMFTPDKFNEKYIVSTVPQPTGQLLELVNICFEKKLYNEIDIEAEANTQIDDKYIFFGSTKKLDKRKANWDNKLFWNYLDFLNDSKNKIVISIDEWDSILGAVDVLKNHKFTKDIFSPNEELEAIPQYPFTFEYNGILYKGLIDLLVIDHKNKIIYVYDLKTTGSGLKNFISSIFHWRYDIQSSLYYHGVQANFSDYKIQFFRDVTYSFTDRQPLIYDLTSYVDKARDGYEDKFGNYRKGWLQLTEEYLWHKENDIWDFDKQTHDNNGLIVL